MSGLAETTDWLKLFADPTRVRLLALVGREALTVPHPSPLPEGEGARSPSPWEGV